jgi:group I intron endonuclease
MINIQSYIPVIGIYKITSPSGKIYVGQSINIIIRWRKYKRLDCKNQIKLYNSFKKHGSENHKFEIVEECYLEQLNEREIFWMDKYKTTANGLNIKDGGSFGKHSDETKLKISKSLLGKEKTLQHKNNIKVSRKGMSFTQQHKNNMSNSRFRYSIICLQNNIIYKSVHHASKELNIYPSSILNVCKGLYKQTKGYTFRFI